MRIIKSIILVIFLTFIFSAFCFNVEIFNNKINFIPLLAKTISEKSQEVLGTKIVKEEDGEEVIEKHKEEVKTNKFIAPYRLGWAEDKEIKSKYSAVLDAESNTLLFDKNSQESVPIASITKLMTALVFLDNNPGWDETYKITRSDKVEGGTIYLFPGDEITIRDLFNTSLIASANTATNALIKSTGLSTGEFVSKMNRKAKRLGLNKTVFCDTTGLCDENLSTAYEVAILAKEALSHEDIREATLTKKYSFETLGGKRKVITSTDYLLDNLPPNGIEIIGGKTGFTIEAGFCFVGAFIHEGEHEVISVVLNSPTYSSRFTETKDLVEWIYESYKWED